MNTENVDFDPKMLSMKASMIYHGNPVLFGELYSNSTKFRDFVRKEIAENADKLAQRIIDDDPSALNIFSPIEESLYHRQANRRNIMYRRAVGVLSIIVFLTIAYIVCYGILRLNKDSPIMGLWDQLEYICVGFIACLVISNLTGLLSMKPNRKL